MLGEGVLELDQQLSADLPVLTPLLVAPDTEVDAIIREGRAEVAMLTLELRAARHQASQTQQLDESTVDVEGARELLQVSLERHLDKRRADFADAIEQVRLEAASIVSGAHTEATALLSAANAEVVATLLRGVTAVPDDAAPMLRVVEEDEVADRAARSAHPTAPLLTETAPQPVDPNLVALASYLATAIQMPVVAPAPVAVSAQPAPSATKESRWSVKQFLYLDVVLPVIAVLIVIVVLLAWVG